MSHDLEGLRVHCKQVGLQDFYGVVRSGVCSECKQHVVVVSHVGGSMGVEVKKDDKQPPVA